VSIYATLWKLRFPREGDAHHGCDWIEVTAQAVPAHIGSPTPGGGYEAGDPFADFLPPAIQTDAEGDAPFDRAVVFVTEYSIKATPRHPQEYASPLLVLTGEEILDSGIQIFARPPGKKNASIQLLSGGEKALTAMSLVFSLFQLNPAPFCLLDEVDAPLDDTNTERFRNLLTKMSEHTQFLFISHNKITMEGAHQLVGVTMQEQGVSRVVTVDMDQAMRLTEDQAA
jgi:hypothetical protein